MSRRINDDHFIDVNFLPMEGKFEGWLNRKVKEPDEFKGVARKTTFDNPYEMISALKEFYEREKDET